MDERLVFSLELSPGDPITGHLYDRRGDAVPFAGWIALATAIEDARALVPASTLLPAELEDPVFVREGAIRGRLLRFGGRAVALLVALWVLVGGMGAGVFVVHARSAEPPVVEVGR